MTITPEDQNIPIKLSSNPGSFWIKEIGLLDNGGTFRLDLYSTLADNLGRRGTFYTTIPISPLEYRLQEGRDRAKIQKLSGKTIRVFDDWGTHTDITTQPEIIEALLKEAEKFKLLADIY